MEAVVDRSLVKRDPFHEEMQIVRADGAVRVIDAHGKVILRADGSVAKMVGTAQDVTERRAVERKLALQEEAEAANRAKSEFLSRMSHELRTPMNSILGLRAAAASWSARDDASARASSSILKARPPPAALINEVLEIARIEAGPQSFSLEPVHARRRVAEARGACCARWRRSAAIELESDVPRPAHAFVHADRQRLTQVLLNLLSNAIKYNRPGGSVRISLRDAGGRRLRILRGGHRPRDPRGAAEQALHALRPAGRGADRVEGTGLGLRSRSCWPRRWAARSCSRASRGQGAFPRGAAASRPRPPRLDDVDHAVPSGPRTATRARTGTLLYVEDNLANLRLVERILASARGAGSSPRCRGGVGVELAREHRPDLSCSTCTCPDMDGEEVLQRLRADPRTADIPVVMISADATRDRVERLLAGGAEAYLTKPLDVDQVHGPADGRSKRVPASVAVGRPAGAHPDRRRRAGQRAVAGAAPGRAGYGTS